MVGARTEEVTIVVRTTHAHWSLRIGRALFAAPFVSGAASVPSDSGPLPGFAHKAGVPHLELATKVAAAAMGAGALAVGTGVAPVVGGVVLAASLIATTVLVHDFWSPQEEAVAAAHRKNFIANCGLLGGVIVVSGLGRARQLGQERPASQAATDLASPPARG